MQTWRWEYSLIAAAMLVVGMLLIAGLRTDTSAGDGGNGARHAGGGIPILAALAI